MELRSPTHLVQFAALLRIRLKWNRRGTLVFGAIAVLVVGMQVWEYFAAEQPDAQDAAGAATAVVLFVALFAAIGVLDALHATILQLTDALQQDAEESRRGKCKPVGGSGAA